MPGLFGILSKTPGLTERGLKSMASRMASSMRPVPWLSTEIWGDGAFCGGRVHLGVLNPRPQPIAAEGSPFRLWFHGEIYPPSGDRGRTPDIEEVLDWVSPGGGAIAELDGVFSLACYDAENRELVLANDRLGFRPVYYTETSEWFAYAAEVKALLAILPKAPELDEVSLRQFFGFDYLLGERTWWKGIELIPPAAVWRISADRRTSTRYWSFADLRPDPREEADVVMELGRLWSRAVHQRKRPGTTPLLLSGGLDSRLLLAELRAQEADLVAITFGAEGCPDMRIARRCARLAGVRHRAVHLNEENWWHRREEAIWQTDGLVNGIHLPVASALDELHTGNGHTLKNSTADTLFGGSKLKRVSPPDWTRAPRDLLDGMFSTNPFFSAGEVAEASLGDCERYLEGPSTDSFVISQRQRRMILTGPAAMETHCEVVNPGISLPILRLVLGSLSDEQRMKSKFYVRFLVSRYPRYFRDIPWQATGRGLAESFPTRISRGIRRGVASMTGGGTKPKGFANYRQFLRDSRTREKLLNGDLLVDDFLGGAARRYLEGPQCLLGKPEGIVAILTLETYLRQVAGVPGLAPPSAPSRTS